MIAAVEPQRIRGRMANRSVLGRFVNSTEKPSADQHAARQIARAVGSGSRLQSISQMPEGAIPAASLLGVAVRCTALA
jgi:hypothetical protein